MAINFGDTILEGGIEPEARVQNPVQDDSGAVLAQALAPAAEAIGAIAGSIFKSGQEDANAKILTQYENDLLDLADAVDQGLDRNEAMIKARALRRQYLSNAPALQDDFDTIWTDFAGANGLGHVVIQGTVEQQAYDAQVKEAISQGYTPQEYQLFQSRLRGATELNYQLTQMQNSNQVVSETLKSQALQSTIGLAQSAYPAAQRQINDAMAAIQANPAQKPQIIENLNMTLGQQVAQWDSMVGAADAGFITQPVKDLLADFNKFANGEISNTVMENTLKSTQLKYDLMYASDPTLGPVIAASKMIGEIGMQNSDLFNQLFTPQVIAKFGEITHPNKTINLTDNTDASARTVEAIRQAAGMVGDSSDPEFVQEVMNSINQAVDSAYVHERTADGALGFKDIVELLGSPEVGAIVASQGISARYADQFVGILKANYETELLPVINRTWTSPYPLQNPVGNERVVPNNTPMMELIEPRWNGNAVEFIPRAGYENDPRVINLANEMTSGDSSIGVPLNNLINAYANVTGTDAKTIYEQDFAERLFGVTEEGEATSPLAEGVVEPGNIDLLNRPILQNEDGTISTERSFSINEDGVEILLPTVINGRIVSEDEAIEHYHRTGEHLGKFETVEAAEQAAEQIHLEQEERYSIALTGNEIGEPTEPVEGVEINPISDLTLEDFNPEELPPPPPLVDKPEQFSSMMTGASNADQSPVFEEFYSAIKGRANLMSGNPSRWGRNSNTREWQMANLVTIKTPGGVGAQVHREAAPYFQGFINELESMGYRIRQFGGYNYRNKRGGSSLSEHAFGNAIDINWDKNPMTGTLVTDLPANISRIAAKYGLSWGGDWKSTKDAMHFEWTGNIPPLGN